MDVAYVCVSRLLTEELTCSISNGFVFSTVSFYTINNDYTQYTVNGERFAGLKHLWFQPYEFFHGNAFTVPWPAVFIIYS